jgi:two-component sensor histidine kinase
MPSAVQEEDFRFGQLWSNPLVWLGVGGFWGFLMLMTAVEMHVTPPGRDWGPALRAGVLTQASWMLVCLTAMCVPLRVPLSRRTVPSLLVITLALVFLRAALYNLQIRLIPGPPLPIGLALIALPSNLLYVGGFLALGYAVKHFVTSTRQERTASRLEAQLATARLEMLHRQLQPHFLFNSLNTVSALLRRDARAAGDTLRRLERLFRIALERTSTPTVTLHDELDTLDLYLGIERQRYPDRLRVETRVAEEARRARIPPLLLQPLVENAIRHGVAPRRDTVRVSIRAHLADGWLEIEVRDTGMGVPPGWSLERDAGLGLRITADRLRTMYGDRFVFRIVRAASASGTRVLLRVPA